MQPQKKVLVKKIVDELKLIELIANIGNDITDKDLRFIANQLNKEIGCCKFIREIVRELDA